MPHFDDVTRGTKRPIEIIEAHRVKTAFPTQSDHIVAENNAGHVDRSDLRKQVWVDRPRQDDPVDQAMSLEDGRKIDSFRSHTRSIVKGGEKHVLLNRACVGFDTLQDTGVKGMEKIAVAQKKANHL